MLKKKKRFNHLYLRGGITERYRPHTSNCNERMNGHGSKVFFSTGFFLHCSILLIWRVFLFRHTLKPFKAADLSSRHILSNDSATSTFFLYLQPFLQI